MSLAGLRLWIVKLRVPSESAAARALDVDDQGAGFW